MTISRPKTPSTADSDLGDEPDYCFVDGEKDAPTIQLIDEDEEDMSPPNFPDEYPLSESPLALVNSDQALKELVELKKAHEQLAELYIEAKEELTALKKKLDVSTAINIKIETELKTTQDKLQQFKKITNTFIFKSPSATQAAVPSENESETDVNPTKKMFF